MTAPAHEKRGRQSGPEMRPAAIDLIASIVAKARASTWRSLLSTVLQRAMSSSSNKGAAEEPEPEPGPPSPSSSSATAAAAPYDPREYQPAHPDDRGGDGKPTKKGGGKAKGKGGAKSKAKGGAKGKAEGDEDDATHRCGNCDAPDAKRKCKGCGVEYYCGRECQTVGLQAWVGVAAYC